MSHLSVCGPRRPPLRRDERHPRAHLHISKRALPVIACALLLVVCGTFDVAPLAAASSPEPTATAPQQLVHSYPLGPHRLCCTGPSGARSAAGLPRRPARSVARSTGGTGRRGLSPVIWIVVGAGVLLLVALAVAIYRRSRAGPALFGTPVVGIVTNGNAERGRMGKLSRFVHVNQLSPPETEPGSDLGSMAPIPAAAGGAMERDRAELAYRRADQDGHAGGAFNLGVLLQQRRDFAGAAAAYERAEQRGDPDATFNLGVLLYETGDLDGAEAAWRRCVRRRDPRAAANLGFLLRLRGDLDGARTAYDNAERWAKTEDAGMATAELQHAHNTTPAASPHNGDGSHLR
jgi:hypothetical protein